MLGSVRAHLKHHARFYAAALLGIAVGGGTGMLGAPLRLVVAGDAFFAMYLVSTALVTLEMTPGDMRERASYEDEGIALIVLLTLGAVSVSLVAIFTLINRGEQSVRILLGLTAASVPLGWLTLHTVLALRYAHLYYTRGEADDEEHADVGGLAFPETKEPGLWDFLYYSYVIGMTSQVSDVQVLSRSMRRLTLLHGVTSFFFNTVLLALAVNIAASYAH